MRRGEYDGAKKTIPLELEVTEGPRVQMNVMGAKFSGGELKKLIPIYRGRRGGCGPLGRGKRNLRERLERQGYFDADVSYTTEMHEGNRNGGAPRGTEETITYKVERGDQHKLIGIEIKGNKYFDTELLRSRLQIYGGGVRVGGTFQPQAGGFGRAIDEEPISGKRILDAKVEQQTEDDYKGKNGDLYIRFVIQEGKQTRVASLSIEGIHAFKQEELLGVVSSTSGQPYSDFNVTTDRDNILALYFNEGFPEANFTATADRVAPESAGLKADTEGKTANSKKKRRRSGKKRIRNQRSSKPKRFGLCIKFKKGRKRGCGGFYRRVCTHAAGSDP